MDKKQYERPEMQVILTHAADIITASGIDEGETEIVL